MKKVIGTRNILLKLIDRYDEKVCDSIFIRTKMTNEEIEKAIEDLVQNDCEGYSNESILLGLTEKFVVEQIEQTFIELNIKF